jgi:hypothetical protein
MDKGEHELFLEYLIKVHPDDNQKLLFWWESLTTPFASNKEKRAQIRGTVEQIAGDNPALWAAYKTQRRLTGKQ